MSITTDRNTRSPLSMTLLLLLGLGGFLLWASLFELDQTVRATGQLMPSARTQIIQTVDGGVLSEILVREGQQVTQGQRLAVLEQARSNAAFEESRAKEIALEAALIRAQAEAQGVSPVFGAKFKEFSEFTTAQKNLYEQRKRSLQEELATLHDSLGMAQEELRMNEALLKTGDISRLEVMRAKRQVSELQGKLSSVRNKYLQDARTEASKLQEELSSSRFKRDERESVLGHTVLTTPVSGIVKYLRVTTMGGVLRAGDELMQISPTDGGMVLELKLNPVDIGQVQIGLPVTVKFDAFDYSVYGSLHGKLSYISSDTLVEQTSSGQALTYYRAHVQLDAPTQQANHKLSLQALKPGMTATADIRTDSRSVLRYLVKPIMKAFTGAMNER